MTHGLTLNVQDCRDLQAFLQSFMDCFTSDLFLVIELLHRKGDNRHGDSSFLVDCLSAALPSLACQIPLETWWRVTSLRHTLHWHFRAGSGQQRTCKWRGISRELQVDRTWWSWKYYSWAFIWFCRKSPNFQWFLKCGRGKKMISERGMEPLIIGFC